MAEDKSIKTVGIPLDGKLVKSEHPALIGKNFSTLENMRYRKASIESINGQTKINTAVFPGKVEILDAWTLGYFGADPISASLAPSAGTNRIALIGIYGSDSAVSRTVSSVTLGGQSCTQIDEQTEGTGDELTLSYWYLEESGIAAMSGSSFVVTWSTAPDGAEALWSGVYQYVHQSTLVAASAGTSGVVPTLTPAGVSVIVGDYMVYITTSYIGAHSPAAGYTEELEKNKAVAATKAIAITGTETPTTNWVGGNGWGKCMISAVLRWDGTATSAFLETRSGYHYEKHQPAKSHVLVQAFNSGGTASEIIENTATIPSQGAFGNVVHSDKSGAGVARFSEAPDGQVAVCNGEESLVWGGDEMRCAAFVIGTSDPYDGTSSDYTRAVNINNSDAQNLAIFSQTHAYVGSVRPLKGVKFYIEGANTTITTLIGAYWNGAWTVVNSISDGTSASSITLAQTGSVAFEEQSDAKPTFLFDRYLYWYRFYDGVTGTIDVTTTISYVTQDAAMQSIVDLWDGVDRPCIKAIRFDTTDYADYTIEVAEEDYQAANDYTFMPLDAMDTTWRVYLGFAERMAGLFVVVKDSNDIGSVLTVSSWTGAAWAALTLANDGTDKAGDTIAHSGVVSWTPPNEGSEFQTEINKNNVKLYYYELKISVQLSASVDIDYIAGIPAQKVIAGYTIPMTANSSLWLCNEKDGKKNSALSSAPFTASVFNGDQSTEESFGDDSGITGTGFLYSQFGSSLYNVMVFCKEAESWVIVGNSPENWIQYRALSSIGCVAPGTIKHVTLDPSAAPNLNKEVLVWMGANGIYVFDGKSATPIHDDIRNFFDENHADYLTAASKKFASAFVDELRQEYHLLLDDDASGEQELEWVFSFKKWAWSEVVRGTSPADKRLQVGFVVRDTDSNNYNYGLDNFGFMYRLENGDDFDGNALNSTFQIGDLAIHKGDIGVEIDLRGLGLVMEAQNSSTNSVAVTHYGDGDTTGMALQSHSPVATGKDITRSFKTTDKKKHLFHSIKMTFADVFKPLYLYVRYKVIRNWKN